MSRTTRTTPTRWRRITTTLGLVVLIVAAVAVAVVAELIPEDTPLPLIVFTVVGGLVAYPVVDRLVGWLPERRTRRRAVAEVANSFRARAPEGFAALLSPRRKEQIVTFLGRRDLLAELLNWCTNADQDTRPFRLITGPGGVGKTRLADELQRRLRALDVGWDCMFLSMEQGKEVGAVNTLRKHARDKPVLVVVDYAENRPRLCDLLVEALNDEGTIRVLLLARTAGNWWDRLTNIPGDLGAALTAGYDNIDLPNIDVEQQDILDAAAGAFARVLGTTAPRVHLGGSNERTPVLDLTAGALVAVLRSKEQSEQVGGRQHVTVGEVFDELLRHEAATYWAATASETGLADQLTVAMRQALVAAVALLGANDEPATVALTQRVLRTFTEDPPPHPEATALWLRKTYTPADGSGHWVEPLTPDRVAEHLITRVLIQQRHATRRVGALLENLSTAQAVQAMTVLSRAATDPARNEDQQGAVRMLADHLAEHLPNSSEAYPATLAAVRFPSVRMAPTAALLARRYVNHLDASGKDGKELAGALHDLGLALSQVGRPDEALPHKLRSVRIYEQLAESDADSNLAASLASLGITLAELGQHHQALLTTQRAVRIYGQLARSDPDQFEPDFATSVYNLGRWFSQMERHGHALLSALRATRIYCRLARSNPDRFESERARSLADLGSKYLNLGRPGIAVLPNRLAVQIYERLADSDPDRYEPELAVSMTNLGVNVSHLGRVGEALHLTHQAVRIQKHLSESNPDRFVPEFAASLTNLGNFYQQIGDLTKAPHPIQQAVQICRPLARSDPDKFGPALAKSLTDLGACYMLSECPDKAFAAWEEARAVLQECRSRGASLQLRHVEFVIDSMERALANNANDVRGHDQKSS